MLEIIVKNWYVGQRELPPIPDNFAVSEIVKDRKPVGHIPARLRELYIENNLPSDKGIPCIYIMDHNDLCFWPVEFYNGCDPGSNQNINIDYYQQVIQRLYLQLGHLEMQHVD